MAEEVDCVVVGAGVIGLAVARHLALAGREVVIVEAAQAFGTETSSRNSEVIHAGLYYPHNSLKARLCLAGRDRLYAYLAEHGVEHERCGKLIVAVDDEEIAALRALAARAQANGVDDVRLLDAAAARSLEPELRCKAAMLSPATGILDSHGYMLALLGEAEDAGAALAVGSPVVGGRVDEGGVRLGVGGDAPLELSCRLVVNAAGLGAHSVATALEGFPRDRLPPRALAKGNYFALAQRPPFTRLVYPLPEAAGLGVHYTRDLAGAGRFGPDVEWIDRIDYSVDPSRCERFYAAVRRYWPGLRDGALVPAYAGIRPKISAPGAPAADFLIQGPEAHGVPGLVNLFGFESPGLTASLAIAEAVAERLGISPPRSSPAR
jgi:L-2-hydroxyglutarate oxidase LhgO